MRMRHIVFRGLFDSSTIFLHIISWTAILSAIKVTEHKMRVSIFSSNFVWNSSYSKKNYNSTALSVTPHSSCALAPTQHTHPLPAMLQRL